MARKYLCDMPGCKETVRVEGEMCPPCEKSFCAMSQEDIARLYEGQGMWVAAKSIRDIPSGS